MRGRDKIRRRRSPSPPLNRTIRFDANVRIYGEWNPQRTIRCMVVGCGSEEVNPTYALNVHGLYENEESGKTEKRFLGNLCYNCAKHNGLLKASKKPTQKFDTTLPMD